MIMKKCVMLLLCALLLCGCRSADTFETLGDDHLQSVLQQQKKVQLTLEQGAVPVQGETGTVYFCDGYEVSVEVWKAGNISGTLQTLTGFGADDLMVIETSASGFVRYECIWVSTGEGGDQVGRVVVLDDGVYHYCITFQALADDAPALQLTWQQILDSVHIA
jgi:hypothetical protein